MRKKTIGVIFIILGLVIFLTPFTPGSAIGLVGLRMVLGNRWPNWLKFRKKKKPRS